MARIRKRENISGRLEFEYVDLNDLVMYENNPRQNEKAVPYVKNSIQKFGFLVPIVIDSNNVIAAGHTRYLASKELGLAEVPCIRASGLTQEQIGAFRLADNKVAEQAGWDADLLAEEMSIYRNAGMDFTMFGWSQEEIDCLTDVVSEDCLSAGSAASSDTPNRRRVEQRAPGRARLVLGEFVFFIDQEVYRQWASAVRVDGDYNETEITNILKERLGITPYENGRRQ